MGKSCNFDTNCIDCRIIFSFYVEYAVGINTYIIGIFYLTFSLYGVFFTKIISVKCQVK